MTSYRELIQEHDEIEAATRILIDEINSSNSSSFTAVVTRLSNLADLVSEHVAKENAVLTTAQGKAAIACWGHEWTLAADSFEQLRDKWMHFLMKWDEATIAAHWPEFRLEARSVMSHLQDQVLQETDLFYSSALREGTISLQ